MLPPGLKSAREVKQYYDQVYLEHINSGKYVPFLYPWATIGFAVVLIFLLIDHRKSPALASLRKPLFGFLCAFSTWSIVNNKARSPAAAYGVGLVQAWGTLWTSAIMFFNDCQVDFKRLERGDLKALGQLDSREVSNGSLSNGSTTNSSDKSKSHSQRLQRADILATQGSWQRTGPLFWQPYPTRPFIERLEWILDIFCAFRGVGWNFQIHGMPELPPSIVAELSGSSPPTDPTLITSSSGIRRFTTRAPLLRACLTKLIISTIALDIVKTLMHHDAYFWGYTSAPAPSWFPYPHSYPLLKSYRLLTCLFALYFALNQIFSLGPLISIYALPGLRSAPFMNPLDFWGSYRLVLDKGLAGWWGAWWHQTFRYAFEAPTTWLGIDKKTEKGRLISLFIAFALSGALHTCGSYTQLGDSRPLLGPFRFFILQAVGIALEAKTSQLLDTKRLPKRLRQTCNFLFVNTWMYFTAPLLVDDFAQGGAWLYEPLAISPLRMLGFGAKDDNGWDLWYGLIFWHQGKHWWDTGIAF